MSMIHRSPSRRHVARHAITKCRMWRSSCRRAAERRLSVNHRHLFIAISVAITDVAITVGVEQLMIHVVTIFMVFAKDAAEAFEFVEITK